MSDSRISALASASSLDDSSDMSVQDGTSIFSSGVDQKTAEFRLVNVASSRSSGAATRRWIQSSGRRLHSHDVRTMIVSPPYTLPSPADSSRRKLPPQVPILTSGGLDLNLIIVSVSPASRSQSGKKQTQLKNPVSDVASTEFETTIHRRAAYVPQRSQPFSVAGDARLLVCRRDRSVGIWRLEDPKPFRSERNGGSVQGRRGRESTADGENVEDAAGWTKMLDMDLKLQTNLVASAVSKDGRWLAVSDLYETKLFRLVNVRISGKRSERASLTSRPSQRGGEITPRRQKTFSTHLAEALPTSLGTGSSSLVFTSDSARLILSTSFGSYIAVVELPNGKDDEFDVVKVFGQHGERDGVRELRGKVASRQANGNGDVSMNGVNGVNGVHHGSDSASESDESEEEQPTIVSPSTKPALVAALTVSTDGQWLASADLERKVCVFDLTALRVSCAYPPLNRTEADLNHHVASYYSTNTRRGANCPFLCPHVRHRRADPRRRLRLERSRLLWRQLAQVPALGSSSSVHTVQHTHGHSRTCAGHRL